MVKEKDQVKRITVEQEYVNGSIKAVLAQVVQQSTSEDGNGSIKALLAEVVQQSNSESVQKITVQQTELFYTRPIHRARKYDLF